MDEFRLGLLDQMGQNRSRTRRHREPWFFAIGCTPIAVVLVWLGAGLILGGGIFLVGWGMTLYRLSRNNGSELFRLGGQLLALVGIVVTGFGAWRRFG